MNGTLTDAEGNTIEEISEQGPGPGGTTLVETIDFAEVELNVSGQFFDDRLFPGLAVDGSKDLFATEVVAFVELPVGEIRMGVTAGFARTDVVNDDGWRLFCGTNPRSYFNTLVAEFNRNAPPFPNDAELAAGNRTEFTITVTQAGVYPLRLVYWQQTAWAMLEWYIVKDPDGQSEERVLLNGGNGAPVAYRGVTNVPAAVGPYVAEVSPLPDAAGVPSSQPVELLLVDGATTVVDSSLKLFLNNTQVTPQEIDRVGSKLFVAYTPNASRPSSQNAMRLEFQDSGGANYTQSWQFVSTVAGSSTAPVAGQWDFDFGDLRATAGSALAYLDGPAGLTAQGTQFGTTAEFGIDPIDGQPAVVLKVPGDLDRNIGYVMNHGISPNGGGTRVNQYTLIMDVFVEAAGPGAASLWQTSSLANTDDGDLFWQANQFGQGNGGYNGTGQFTAGAWHRIAAAYDMAADPPVVVKYVDGIKQDDWTANQGIDNVRRTLLPTAILFGDGDQDERRVMYVSSIQIRPERLSDAHLALLGGPTSAGIPVILPGSTVAGQWDFNGGNLAATVGSPLQYFDGAGGLTESGTDFGSTTELAISDIGTQPAQVMVVPGDLTRDIGYIMTHRIAPNGGGERVNQYTLIMDVMIAGSGPGAAAMLQVNPTNSGDGDLFWQGNNYGQGTGGYNGTGEFVPDTWHRVAAAYNMAATPPVVVKYLNGVFQDNWTANQGLDNDRRALLPTALLFADGDADERRQWWVNSVQIRAGALNGDQLAALGGPEAAGIPLNVPDLSPPVLSFGRGQASFVVMWPTHVTGWDLESSINSTLLTIYLT
ncbi:MAG: hypothetical protein ACKV19_09205 [Verrucomicrobiales bacterium]